MELLENMRTWADEELYSISNVALEFSSDSLENLRMHKHKEVFSYLIKCVLPASFVTSVRENIKAYKYWSNQPIKSSNLSEKDALLQKFCHLSAKKTYLQKCIEDLKTDIVQCDVSYRLLNQSVLKDQHISAVSNVAKHYYKEKASFYGNLNYDMNALIQNLVLSDLNCKSVYSHGLISLSSDSNSSVHGSLQMKLYDPQSFIDSSRAVSQCKEFFMQSIKMHDENMKKGKVALWYNIMRLLSLYVPQDILSNLQNDVQVRKKQLSVFCNDVKNLKNKTQSTYATCTQATLEINALKKECMDIFMSKQKASSDMKKLIIKKVEIIDAYLNEMCKDEFTLKHLLELKCSVSASCSSIEFMKQSLFDTQNALDTFQQTFEVKSVESTDKINCQDSEISGNSIILDQLLKQNDYIFNLFSQQISALNIDFLQEEKHYLQDLLKKLNYDVSLQKSINVTNQYCNDINKTCATNKQVTQLFDLHLYQDETIILQNLMDLIFNHHGYVNSIREKTLRNMKSHGTFSPGYHTRSLFESQRNKNQQLLECVLPKISDGLNLQQSERCILSSIGDHLTDWLNQPAQFIPNIMVNNMSLKDFLTLMESSEQ